jgi:hypothetical protein
MDDGIIIHVSEEARKNYETKKKREKPKVKCPACEIQKLINKEIENEISRK